MQTGRATWPKMKRPSRGAWLYTEKTTQPQKSESPYILLCFVSHNRIFSSESKKRIQLPTPAFAHHLRSVPNQGSNPPNSARRQSAKSDCAPHHLASKSSMSLPKDQTGQSPIPLQSRMQGNTHFPRHPLVPNLVLHIHSENYKKTAAASAGKKQSA